MRRNFTRVKQLKKILEDLDPNKEIIMASDKEGNYFQDINDITLTTEEPGWERYNGYVIWPDNYISEGDL